MVRAATVETSAHQTQTPREPRVAVGDGANSAAAAEAGGVVWAAAVAVVWAMGRGDATGMVRAGETNGVLVVLVLVVVVEKEGGVAGGMT